MTSILVTGPSGFLGYHVIKLLNARDVKPRVLLPADADDGSDAVRALKQQDVEIVNGSVLDPSSLHAACEGVDTVIHMKFAINAGSGPEVEQELEQTNVVGVRNMLDAATKAGVERVVVSSTVLGIGLNRKPEPLDESADWNIHRFDLPYAVSRRTAALEAMARPGGDGNPTVVVVDPSFTLGPDDHVGAPANGLIRKMATGLRVTARIGFGVLDVRDFADGVLRAAERGQHGQRYILSGANINPDILQKEVAAVTGRQPPRFKIPLQRWFLYPLLVLLGLWNKLRGKPPKVALSLLQLWGRHAWYDTSRAGEQLGWKPRPLQESLKDVLNEPANENEA